MGWRLLDEGELSKGQSDSVGIEVGTVRKGRLGWGKVSRGNGWVGKLSCIEERRSTPHVLEKDRKGIGTGIGAWNIDKGTGLITPCMR